jgi:hypothetical protein
LRRFFATALLAGVSWSSIAQTTTADEYEIRAAMLLNLTRFIVWPASKFDAAHPQFLLCIVGSDPIMLDVDRTFQNQNVAGKPVQVRHLSSLDGASSCHVLYVSGSQRKNVERVQDELMKNGVLTVSERANSNSPSQIIGLPALDERVRIEVNLGAAQRTGLTISSRLLHLATVTQ